MNTTHTPGPWVVDAGNIDDLDNMLAQLSAGKSEQNEWVAVGITDNDGYAASVAYCHQDNAPLISAAPELLECLERVREAFYVKGTTKALRAAFEGTKEVCRKAKGLA